jgi:predicted peptidase
MRRRTVMVCAAMAVVVLFGCATLGGKATPVQTGLLTKSMSVTGQLRNYALYVPPIYSPNRKWPLIVFLHGIGERGDDGLLQTTVGIYPAVQRDPDRFPCLILMPQCPVDRMWTAAMEHIDAAIEQTLSEYRVDSARIYLTGLSMGGFGAWEYGARNNTKFAALLPICGGGRESNASRLTKLPIWAFHGAADPVVKPDASRRMVEAVKAARGTVSYTEFPGVGHNSWDKAFGDPEVIRWLLEQRKQ